MDLATEATGAVEKIDSLYLTLCYWPGAIRDKQMASGLTNLQAFATELKRCAKRHNGLVEWHNSK